MRLIIFSLLLSLSTLFPLSAQSFEIEEEALFEVETPDRTLRIISTSDLELFTPLILAFQLANPTVQIEYTSVVSTELMQAIYVEGAVFDLAISSAMDLQVKLANDGFTRPYSSVATGLLPEWALWRNHVFAFTREPASIVISPAAFEGLDIPHSRQELITVLRNNPDRFRGRVGTYDVRESGLGYLFATQDARTSETYWRLMEVMGSLNTALYCCSGEMIADVSSGRLAVAYNVLGNYADARRALGDEIEVIAPQDFTTMMLRSAVIPLNATNPDIAGDFVDHLLVAAWGPVTPDYYPFPAITRDATEGTQSPRPIRLGPGLLVFLDDLKRRRFLREWEDAIEQP